MTGNGVSNRLSKVSTQESTAIIDEPPSSKARYKQKIKVSLNGLQRKDSKKDEEPMQPCITPKKRDWQRAIE